MEYIFLLGAGQGLLLTVFLLTKKENFLANRIFALAIFAYTLDILNAFILADKLFLRFPVLIGLGGPLPFVYSPAIYLYTVYFNRKYKQFRKKDLLHFIPVLLMILAGIRLFFLSTPEEKIALMNPNTPKSIWIIISRTIIPFYGILYTILSLFEVRKYHIRLKDNFSDIERLKLNWLVYLLLGIIIEWLLEFVQIFLIEVLRYGEAVFYNYIYLFVSLFMYLVAYKSLQQPEIYMETDNEEQETADITEQKTAIKKRAGYKKSGLTDEKASEYTEKLLEIMDKEKPYINPEINLNELAGMLNISPHNLTEIINTRLHVSFYDFISSYRVEEVKRLMAADADEKYSILSIALDAGFNSKSAFNNVFKKITGITPSDFRKEIAGKASGKTE